MISPWWGSKEGRLQQCSEWMHVERLGLRVFLLVCTPTELQPYLSKRKSAWRVTYVLFTVCYFPHGQGKTEREREKVVLSILQKDISLLQFKPGVQWQDSLMFKDHRINTIRNLEFRFFLFLKFGGFEHEAKMSYRSKAKWSDVCLVQLLSVEYAPGEVTYWSKFITNHC